MASKQYVADKYRVVNDLVESLLVAQSKANTYAAFTDYDSDGTAVKNAVDAALAKATQERTKARAALGKMLK